MNSYCCECNNCGETIDGGVRYHCSECSGYNLCETCYNRKIHPEHYMAREENKVDPFSIVSSSKTVGEFLHQAFSVYKARLMVGQRKILPSGDIAKVFSWRTYAEMYDDVIRVYTGLVNELSIPPKSLISVCSKNSLNWLVADFAIQYAGCVSAPIHCEVDNDSIVQILNTAETVCVFCDRERLQTFTDILATKVCPKLKHVVLLDSGPLPANDGAYKSGTMWTLDDLKKVGSLNLKKEPVKVNPSDICHVIFTSGSTGKPKGVLMVHNDFVPAVCLKPNYDLYVSPGLIPFSLISGRDNVYMCTANGGRIGLRTRADTVFEDLRIMGPTYVSEVPRFYEVLYSEFQALWSKKRAKFIRKNPIYTPQELNAEREKVMVQMREHLGTRLRFVLCGGAPLSSEVSAFLRECWGTNLFREGYGTTEAGQIANGEGVLYPYVQYKIVDCPEMGYTKKDFPYPRGEILVKTPKMRSSFFRNSEETARSFDSEGYFRTGDIVELINPRTIRIIDRKKSIFKLSQGEFVSPVKIENAITKSRFVNSAFATYASASGSGSSSKKKNVIIAVVVVIEDTVRREAPPELRDLPLEELCADKAVVEMIFCDVVKACGSSRLRPFEIPLAVHLECQPWTPESGLLTQSSKVNRAALEKKYKAVVQRLADACAAGEGASMKDDGIVETVASILGISQDDVDKGNIVQTFLRSGGDSMSAIRLTSALSDKFGIQMKPADLFDASLGPVPKFMSVNTISNTLSSRVTDVSEDEGSKMKLLYDVLREDAAALDIPRDWEPRLKAHPVLAPVASPAAPLNVFLTGATGFIGVHVLERLFNVERARVFCLVRCSDEAAGVAKLRAVMDKYRIALNEDKDAKFEGLVKVIPGDLAAEDEHCGMSDESVKLVTSVRNLLFIHCGAYVNHILPYSALRNTNVCGTKKMLRLAYICPGSSFTYVSTASTIMGLDLMPLIYLVQAAGYPQSKWVAEKNVAQFCEKLNIPYIIVRPGMTSWSTKTGVLTDTDWFSRLIRGCSYIHAAPESYAEFSLVPVDFMAEAIVTLSLGKADGISKKAYYNVFNFFPDPFYSLLRLMETAARDILVKKCPVKDPRLADGLKEICDTVSLAVWNDVIATKLRSVERGSHDEEVLSGLRMFRNGLPSDKSVFSPSHDVCCPLLYPLLTMEYMMVMIKNNVL